MNVRRNRRLTVRIAALLAVTAVTGGLLIAPRQAARANPPPNPSNSQINSAKAKKTALANRVGTLSAQVADLQNQVQQREAQAELAEQKLAYALQLLAQAQAAAAAARAKLAQAQATVDSATQKFSEFVRASYMDSPITGPASGLLTAQDPNALLSRSDYVQYSAAHRLDIIGTLTQAKVGQSNADAAARAAESRQEAAKNAATQAKANADAALAAVKAESAQVQNTLKATQSALNAAKLELAVLNNQRAKYIAWQQEQARIAAAKAAAEARARAAAAAAAAARGASSGGNACVPSTTDPGGGSPGQVAVNRAMAFLGCPYSFAGGGTSGPSFGVCTNDAGWNDCHVYGFDCSGLAMYAWAPYLSMAHYAATQYGQAGSYHPSTADLQPGDLVFWSSDGTVAGIHHVAIYIGGGNVIQAPHSGDIVRVTPLGDVDSGYFGATRPRT